MPTGSVRSPTPRQVSPASSLLCRGAASRALRLTVHLGDPPHPFAYNTPCALRTQVEVFASGDLNRAYTVAFNQTREFLMNVYNLTETESISEWAPGRHF